MYKTCKNIPPPTNTAQATRQLRCQKKGNWLATYSICASNPSPHVWVLKQSLQ